MNIPFFKSFQSKLHTRSKGSGPEPARDWLIIVTTALVLLLLSAGWSYWSSLSPNNTGTPEVKQSTDILKTNSIDAVKAIFDKRTAERARYQNEYHFIDPSR